MSLGSQKNKILSKVQVCKDEITVTLIHKKLNHAKTYAWFNYLLLHGANVSRHG